MDQMNIGRRSLNGTIIHDLVGECDHVHVLEMSIVLSTQRSRFGERW